MGNNNKNKVIKLYKGLGWTSLFSRIRFFNAPYYEVESIIPQNGIIVDLGCGEGLFSNFLAICSKNRKIIGVELNKERIKFADKGLENTRFISSDINKVKIPKADAIIFMHVLHHFSSFSEQDNIIEVCKNKLKKNGKLVIIEIERKISLKYFLTSFVDHFIVPWIFEKKMYSSIFFRNKHTWIGLFKKFGFKVKVIAINRFKPFSHLILECNKQS